MFVNLQQMQRDVSKVSSNTDLLAELEKIASDKGFVISDNEGSGNCMFYALSEQLNLVKGIKISHGELRQSMVQYLRNNPKLVSLVYFCHAYSGKIIFTWHGLCVPNDQTPAIRLKNQIRWQKILPCHILWLCGFRKYRFLHQGWLLGLYCPPPPPP